MRTDVIIRSYQQISQKPESGFGPGKQEIHSNHPLPKQTSEPRPSPGLKTWSSWISQRLPGKLSRRSRRRKHFFFFLWKERICCLLLSISIFYSVDLLPPLQTFFTHVLFVAKMTSKSKSMYPQKTFNWHVQNTQTPMTYLFLPWEWSKHIFWSWDHNYSKLAAKHSSPAPERRLDPWSHAWESSRSKCRWSRPRSEDGDGGSGGLHFWAKLVVLLWFTGIPDIFVFFFFNDTCFDIHCCGLLLTWGKSSLSWMCGSCVAQSFI